MHGVLPEALLAPRPFKTGTLATYFSQSLTSLASLMREAFSNSLLEALGVGSAGALSRITERLISGQGTWTIAEQLLNALQCELWLQERVRRADGAASFKEWAASPKVVPISDDSRLCASTSAAFASGTSRHLSEGGL
jgi:hypothetical protein